MQKLNSKFIGWSVTVSYFLFFSGSFLLAKGMFLDGITYAALAKNLSHHLGTFWNPFFSHCKFDEFHDHPPLALGLESVFFRVFGDSYLTERYYSIFIFCCTAFIITLIWKEITNNSKLLWLPLLLWVMIPLIPWAVTANVLENTMSLFTASAVLVYLKSQKASKIIYQLLFSICLLAGFLSKGFVTFFPLALPFCFWICDNNFSFKKFITESIYCLTITTITFFLFFYINHEAAININAYLHIQVLNSLQHLQTVDSRFHIISRMLQEIFPDIILIVLIFIFMKIKKIEKIKFERKNIAWILLGLCGVIPMMISKKQSGFYIIAALPFFAIGFALLIENQVLIFFETFFISKKWNKTLNIFFGMILLCSSIFTFSRINTYGRDAALLSDVETISKIIPAQSSVGISECNFYDWVLQGYCVREKSISLCFSKSKLDYYLSYQNQYEQYDSTVYQPINISLKTLVLLKKK